MNRTGWFLTILILSGTLYGLDTLGMRLIGYQGQNFDAMEYIDTDGRISREDFRFYGLAPRHTGAGVEAYIDRLGFGASATILPLETEGVWESEFDVRTYLTWHLRGTRRFLDLYGEAGIGVAGSTSGYDFDPAVFETLNAASGYTEEWSALMTEQLLIYPHLAVGLAIRPQNDPFTFGARLAYRPESGGLPAGTFEGYSASAFDLSIYAGVSLDFDLSRYRDRVRQARDWFRQIETDRETIRELERDMRRLNERLENVEIRESDIRESDDDFQFRFQELGEADKVGEITAPVSTDTDDHADNLDDDQDASAENDAMATIIIDGDEGEVDWDALRKKIEKIIEEEIEGTDETRKSEKSGEAERSIESAAIPEAEPEEMSAVESDAVFDEIRDAALDAVSEMVDDGDEINIHIDIRQK